MKSIIHKLALMIYVPPVVSSTILPKHELHIQQSLRCSRQRSVVPSTRVPIHNNNNGCPSKVQYISRTQWEAWICSSDTEQTFIKGIH